MGLNSKQQKEMKTIEEIRKNGYIATPNQTVLRDVVALLIGGGEDVYSRTLDRANGGRGYFNYPCLTYRSGVWCGNETLSGREEVSFTELQEVLSEKIEEEKGCPTEKESDFMQIARGLAGLLEYKNKQYGNSALNPINVFAGKSKVGYRADDKISRIQNSEVLRKNDVTDLMGYLILICKENGWLTFDEFKD